MQFSEAGYELLKRSEGFRSRVYMDIAGLPTIGYGHRLLHPASFPDGISEPDAADILISDVSHAIQAVQRLVKVELAQGQFDALVDFVFNLGEGRLATSTLLKKLNNRDYDGAADELLKWDHAGCTEVPALTKRREAEAALWRGEMAA
jgi:lysozyme